LQVSVVWSGAGYGRATKLGQGVFECGIMIPHISKTNWCGKLLTS
jgi:hypothetical protein